MSRAPGEQGWALEMLLASIGNAFYQEHRLVGELLKVSLAASWPIIVEKKNIRSSPGIFIFPPVVWSKGRNIIPTIREDTTSMTADSLMTRGEPDISNTTHKVLDGKMTLNKHTVFHSGFIHFFFVCVSVCSHHKVNSLRGKILFSVSSAVN